MAWPKDKKGKGRVDCANIGHCLMKRIKGLTLFNKMTLSLLAAVLLVTMVPALPVVAVSHGSVSAEEANLRSGPGTDYALLYVLPQGTEFLVNDQQEDDQGRLWYNVLVPSVNLEGWLASWLVTLEPTSSGNQPSGNQAFVNSPANLRGGPGVSFERVDSLQADTPVTILGSAWTTDEELWYQVQMPEGESGWMYYNLLNVAPDLTRTSTEMIGSLVQTTAPLPLRAGPGQENHVDANLQVGAGGRVTGQAIDWRKDRWLRVELLDKRSGWILESQTQRVSDWPLATLQDVTWKLEQGVLLLTVSGTGYITGTPTMLANPYRLVMDIPYATCTASAALFSIKVGDVLRARLRVLDGNLVRLFVDMKRPLDFYKAEAMPGQMIVGIRVDSPHLVVQGNELPQTVQYLQVGPTIYLPLSAISQTMNSELIVDRKEKVASLSYGAKTIYLASDDRRVMVHVGNATSIISMTQPALIQGDEAYIPMESVGPLLNLVASRNASQQVVYLDPTISDMKVEEASQADGTVRTTVSLVSGSPLLYKEEEDPDNHFLFLTVPRAFYTVPQLPSNGVLLEVTRSTTTGAGQVTIAFNLGRQSNYRVETPTDGLGIQVQVVHQASAANPTGKRVVLDPGHGRTTAEGYYDGGAVGQAGTKESTINLDIALRLRTLLEAAGVEVVMTRTGEHDPSTTDLPGRVAIVEQSKADLSLCIHNNSADNTAAQGTETYYTYPKALPLAKMVQQELVKALGTTDRGYLIPSWRMTMVQDIQDIPAVLTEIMFISNANEEKRLNDPAVRQTAAAALFRAVIQYLSTL
jgi:N-acetylmuramoyl-L-alanine amidase